MTGYEAWTWLTDQERRWPMPNGWWIVFRAEIVDPSPGRPHGRSYALILQDENGERLLGYDNSHAFDGASDGDPFDHEHKFGQGGQRFEYRFTTAEDLITDFFARVEQACTAKGVPFEFEEI